MQIGLYVSEMVRDFHNIFFSDMSKSDFEKYCATMCGMGKIIMLFVKN